MTSDIEREVANCPLCGEENPLLLFTSKAMGRQRPFFRCKSCDLIFVPARFHLDSMEEKGQYDLHQNSSSDSGYVAHLKPVLQQVLSRAHEGDVILDFGCGPGPVLSEMIREKNFQVETYDPYFSPDLNRESFDLVTCTEVVEHFCDPLSSWRRLFGYVKEGGHLVVMTSMTDSVEDLKKWHYIRDITHVSFYSTQTMEWLAREFGFSVEIVSTSLTAFH